MTLAEALRNPNVQAFLKMLRHGEGTTDVDGYRRMFGGQLFENGFADHPRSPQTYKLRGGKVLTSTAAGAYQFLVTTWNNLVKQYGFADFSPATQDLAAVALIKGRGALDDVVAGRFNQAVSRCNREWASLPGSPYGQPTVTMEKARSLYAEAGGEFDAMYAPIQKDGGKPVAPFLLAAIPALLEAVPKLFSIFGSGSEISQRNAKAVEAVVEIAKAATGATNEQDLTEKLQDPVAVEQVKAAVEANWFQLTEMVEVGGGVAAAGKRDAAFVESGRQPLLSPAFLVTLMLMPIIYAAAYAVLFTNGFSDDMKAMALGAIFGGLMTGAISGFWYGTSASSARKTEIQAQRE